MRRYSFPFRSFAFDSDGLSAFCYGLLFSIPAVAMITAVDLALMQIFPSAATPPSVTTPMVVERFISAVFFGPPIETLLCQVVVIESIGITSRTRLVTAIAVSTLVFSFIHLFAGGVDQASRMIFGGAFVAGLYCWARVRSKAAAFTVTWTTHAASNAILLALLLRFPHLA